jgi:hypothetical protein
MLTAAALEHIQLLHRFAHWNEYSGTSQLSVCVEASHLLLRVYNDTFDNAATNAKESSKEASEEA